MRRPGSALPESRLGETRAYALVPQPETGKISCVRLPCYGRLTLRQQEAMPSKGIKFRVGKIYASYALLIGSRQTVLALKMGELLTH